MKSIVLITLSFFLVSASFGQETAFLIYNSKGKKVSYKKMLFAMKSKDIVLFGEEHDNPIAHWLQLELTKDLDKANDLVLGAEMIEADNQPQLNNYLSGVYSQKQLDSAARLWPNYQTDYAPLVNYAKDNKLPFIATNIPRRYANKVFKQGFEVLDTLSNEEKSWMATLPMKFDPELPRYKNITVMMGPERGTPKLIMAQATKDATMAHFILKNWSVGKQFIHYNGKYHSDFYEGILWYLKQEKPNLNYGTISLVTQENIGKLETEYLNSADFIICVDQDVTKTH